MNEKTEEIQEEKETTTNRYHRLKGCHMLIKEPIDDRMLCGLGMERWSVDVYLSTIALTNRLI